MEANGSIHLSVINGNYVMIQIQIKAIARFQIGIDENFKTF